MALTKDRLVTLLQTQIGMTKPESRQNRGTAFRHHENNPG